MQGERDYPRQRRIGNALILSPLVTERLKRYLPDDQRIAWKLALLYCKHAGDDKSDATMAKYAASFADALMEHVGAEQRLTEYFSVTDPAQIAAEVQAKTRKSPGTAPWDVVKFLFKVENSNERRSQRKPGNPAGGREQAMPVVDSI